MIFRIILCSDPLRFLHVNAWKVLPFVLVALLLCIEQSNAQTHTELGFPLIRNYSPKEYRSSPQVFSVFQDSQGIIYLGFIRDGIAQYDGRTWRSLNIEKTVYGFAMDRSGRVYVACNNDFGFLEHEQNGRIVFKSLKKDTSQIGSVWSVKSTEHKIYFHTYHIIFEYDIQNQTIEKYSSSERLNGVFVDGNQFYVRKNNVGLMCIKEGKLVTAPHAAYFKDKPYSFTAMDKAIGEKVIATKDKGLVTYFTDSLRPPNSFQLADENFLKDNLMYVGKSLHNGNFLLGSTSKGAILFNAKGEKLNSYQEENTLQNNGVISLISDSSDNYWLGLDIGVSKTESGQDLSYWSKVNGLKGNVFNIHRFKGTLYVATDQFTYYLEQGKFQLLKDVSPAKQNWIFSEFTFGSQHKLLLGYQHGIYDVSKEKQTLVMKAHPCTILKQSTLQPSRLYAASLPNFVSLRYENNQWKEEGSWNGVTGSFRQIIEESDGTLWLGTLDNGIIRIEPNLSDIQNPKSVTYFNQKHGLPSLFDCRPYLIDSRVIIATPKGLLQWNKSTQRFIPYCELGTELCNASASVLLIERSKDHHFFVAPTTNKNADFAWIERNEQKSNLRRIYQPFRRLPEIASVFSSWIDDDGVIWIGTSEGLFRYDRTNDEKNYNQAFPCIIRKVSVANDSIINWGVQNKTDPISKLSYSVSTIKFEFAAPFFDREELTQYAYQLEGMDTQFSPWKTQSTKEYTSLSEGEYTFIVKAKNIYDVESTIATFRFKVLPPWYRTWWAYVIYAGSLALLVASAVRWKTKRLVEKAKDLEQKVKERTIDLAEKNNALVASQEELRTINDSLVATEEELRQNNEELAATNDKLSLALDNLRATQNQLISSEKMASLGQLTAGIAHEINNPLNFISGGIQALTLVQRELLEKGTTMRPEELKSIASDIQDLMDTVTRGIDRTTAIVKGLLTFSNPHEDERTAVDLKERIQSTLVMLNTKAQRAGVKIHTEFNHVNDVTANPSQLGQVLLNLLDNAIHATEQNDGERSVTITTQEQQGQMLIKVKDNGSGIQPEIQSQIFNPFFTTKKVGKGTGLGLSITYSIIQKHDGVITFTSEVGKGTEFVISLPIESKFAND
jgi:signal transduction histidine kinase